MKKIRDLTKGQFDRACQRRGFTPTGVFGYCRIGYYGANPVEVSIHNAGRNRRAQLAYLIKSAERDGVTPAIPQEAPNA